MEKKKSEQAELDQQIALRLRQLRQEKGLSLDQLAALSGVSRATLSRLENAEVSPTTAVLAKLCTAHGLTLSRLMQMAEDAFPAVVRRDAQPVWTDPETGHRRRVISPPTNSLAGEVLESVLPPGTSITYEAPPRPGLEHHLVMLDGKLTVTLDGEAHDLAPGDCLRFQLYGGNTFETPPETGACYLIFMV